MKIARRRGGFEDQGIEVSGPGYEPRPSPTLNAAVGLAMDKAHRLGKPGTFYVRQYGEVLFHAEKSEDGITRLKRAA